jgi:hypothetical protein
VREEGEMERGGRGGRKGERERWGRGKEGEKESGRESCFIVGGAHLTVSGLRDEVGEGKMVCFWYDHPPSRFDQIDQSQISDSP